MTDPELNLDVIAGYNGCDETSEKTMLGKTYLLRLPTGELNSGINM
jgi:hypothetical protein